MGLGLGEGDGRVVAVVLDFLKKLFKVGGRKFESPSQKKLA
jgi:hypothetical protein